MADNEQVTYPRFLRRLRELAHSALGAYDIRNARLTFVNYSGNGIYRVDIRNEDRTEGPFVAGRYALRLHQPDYMGPEQIRSEMEWLSALRREGIEVPEPVRNVEGDWLTCTKGDYVVPRQRNCTLLRWVEGRMVKTGFRSAHFEAIGRMIGMLHRHAMSWKPPKGFVRRHWDWEGLYGDGSGFNVPGVDVRSSIPASYKDNFDCVTKRVQEVLEQLGKRRKVYGLIHADISVGANVLFHSGKSRPIDFDDCGYGYWIFDIAVPLAHYASDFHDTSPAIREALLNGYKEVQDLPVFIEDYLDLFIAARYAQEMAWAQAGVIANPANAGGSRDWLKRAGHDLKRAMKLSGGC